MYERGEREPGLDTVGKLAEYFDVRTDYILGRTNDKRSPKQAKIYNRLILKELEDYRLLHGYGREQMEDMIGLDNMYYNLENDITIGDEGLLKTIQGLLAIDIKTPSVALSDEERILLDLFRLVPEDKQQMLIQMIQVAVGKI
jgi:transcriptional regulator with XRE-family HTH domain